MPINLHETQFQMDQRPQHQTGYFKPKGRKLGNILEHTGTGDNFLNRIPKAKAL